MQSSTALQQQERSGFRPVTDNGLKIGISGACGSRFLRTHDLEPFDLIWGKEEVRKRIGPSTGVSLP